MKTINLEPFDRTLKDLEHYKFHIKELTEQFDDLMVDKQPDGSLAFLSKMLAPLADNVDFYNSPYAFSFNIHYARPYKEIETKCTFCNDSRSIDKIRVGTLPDRIPIFVESQSSDESFIYTMSFEDSMEQLGLSKNIVGKSRIHILEYLKEKSKSSQKISETFVNSSVKKVMVFT